MLTEKDYCDYDTAWELCSLGYPEEDWILLYSAQKWLREEKKLIVLVGFDFCPITSDIVYNWVIVVNGNTAKKSSYTYDYFEEAFSEGIKEAIKHIEII